MPTEHILALLISERDKLNRAIEALQGPIKRRGRPPKSSIAAAAYSDPTMPEWVKPASAKKPARKKRHFSAAQRKQQGERMKAYWAAKKKAEAKVPPTTKGKPKRKAKAA